jgi:hypothetical protein
MNTTTPNPTTDAPAPVNPLLRNELTLSVLLGNTITAAEYALVGNRFHRSSGQKLLSIQSWETATEIVGNEKVTPELKASTQKVIEAHTGAMRSVLETLSPSLITILSHPVGAEKTEELTAAYKELGGLGDRLLSRRFLPGLSTNPDKQATILSGLTRDAYAVAKTSDKLTDLLDAAETRKNTAKVRLTELRASFEEKFTAAQVRLFRTLETMQAIQTDPNMVPYEQKRALLVTVGQGDEAKQVPIFEKGQLTKEAKVKLNEMQAQEGQPEFLIKMIRGVFAKDSQNKEIAAAKKEIGLS